ncbi:hypothetical protein K432DRAFT_158848 [Lepidopterella palustris CBS 459.81]|uniref:Uncharacterized protein n=1 Tax=Lepidopterella palustris CBS 459.81 TaxID=1314670 RepID=A0A8E2E263_9PEZI|nr:hypothetical protein K432DRAFT_158848 [Lepidopterella palustris CBS 459.81]
MCVPFRWPFTDVELEDRPRKRNRRVFDGLTDSPSTPTRTYYYYASAATYAPAATYTPAVTYVPATTYAQAPAYHYYLPHYYYPSGTDGRDVGCAPGTGYHHTYYGRTKEEVDAENRRLATAGGAYDAHEIRPHNPKPDQQFWCREKDGQLTLRTFYTIENDLHPGRWQMGAEKGNLIFVRE